MKVFKKMMLVLVLVALLPALLLGCGKDSNTFKVEYVGTANILSPNMFISSELGGQKMNIGLKEAFQGYTVTKVEFAEGADVTMKGTEDGGICFEGGVLVTLDDGSSDAVVVTIKEGDSFSTQKDGDAVYLLLS